MGLLPGSMDSQPRARRTFVRTLDGAVSHVTVRETPEEVESRLAEDFPLVRIVDFGKEVVAKLLGKKHE